MSERAAMAFLTASNYKETSHCTSTSVVLGITILHFGGKLHRRGLDVRGGCNGFLDFF